MRAVVIPEGVIELMRDAPSGTAGLTIWETAEGTWQVSVKRPDGSYRVRIAPTIQEALNDFAEDTQSARRARTDRLFERAPRRDVFGGRSMTRRYGHPGD